jgi:iron complex outermembrane receptor protein
VIAIDRADRTCPDAGGATGIRPIHCRASIGPPVEVVPHATSVSQEHHVVRIETGARRGAKLRHNAREAVLALTLAASCAVPAAAYAEVATLDPVVVVGTRIRKAEAELGSPVTLLTRDDLEATGRATLGEALQQLSASGSAINTQKNASGNQGAPPDGGGIGAGSVQVDLRHLEAKRVLVLLDGRRWVYESSASGVGGATDFNTIPLAIVESVEILEDGASAIYGSDAIAGVINVITRKRFDGIESHTAIGGYEAGDGHTERAELTLGAGDERLSGMLTLSFAEQESVRSSNRSISSLPVPFTGNTRGSPVNPQGAFAFVTPLTTAAPCAPLDRNGDGRPDASLCQITSAPNSALGANGAVPFPEGYKPLTPADHFNAQPFNLALTPNERRSVHAAARYALTEQVELFARALYNQRESSNEAGPSPIVIGPEAPGQNLADRVGVSRLNPFNPFGIDLVPGVNLFALGRRPLEAGPRIFEQDVETEYLAAGAEGGFGALDRYFAWDVAYVTTRTDAEQVFRNSFNVRRIEQALGNPQSCATIAGCVPLNLFGGQGPDGAGTITPAMLGWIRQDFHDASRQELDQLLLNLTGDALALPAGPLAFATGLEWRRHEGAYEPDSARVRGEVMDLAATQPIYGDYEVGEAFAEFDAPLLRDARFAHSLDLTAALRYSDYDGFDAQTTGKLGLRWRPSASWLVRGTYSEGFRAPFIGELFSVSQFGAPIVDRCSNFNASNNPELIASCTALGVPASYRQLGFQVFTTTGGNPELEPETAESYVLGVVFSPAFAEESSLADTLDIELNVYEHTIDDAIVAPAAQDVLDACIDSSDALSAQCAGIGRNASGQIGRFVNLLDNVGRIETRGADVKIDWSLDTTLGRFATNFVATYVDDYRQTDRFGREFTRTVRVESADSGIPQWQSVLRMDYRRGDLGVGWRTRFIDTLHEPCSDALDNTPLSLIALGLCTEVVENDPQRSRHKLGAVTYHDFRLAWARPFAIDALVVALGVNNAFDKDPPPCLTCQLNGYDATLYDLPGRFWYANATLRLE